MLIVDAQVHIWSAGPPTNPSHRQVSSYTAEECIRDMDAAGVDACILHPPGWDPNSGKISEDAAAKYPNRFAILGNFPLDKPENRSLMASNYLPQVGQIAERHPRLKLILDHYARVRDGKDDAAHGNQAALLALAKYPNVAVKCTGAPGNSSQPYPYRNIHKYTQQIVETFGPQRSFWGTDITRMPCSWKQCVTMFTEEMPWLKGRDLELVMGRAVCDWLGWKLPT